MKKPSYIFLQRTLFIYYSSMTKITFSDFLLTFFQLKPQLGLLYPNVVDNSQFEHHQTESQK